MSSVSNPTPQVQTLVLQEGQSGYIPSNALILAVDGTGIASSDGCIDINPQPSICMIFKSITQDGGDHYSNPLCGLTLKSIIIEDGPTYEIGEEIISYDCISFGINKEQINNKNIPAIKCVEVFADTASESRTEFSYTLKIPVVYADKISLFFIGRYLTTGFYVKGTEVACPVETAPIS